MGKLVDGYYEFDKKFTGTVTIDYAIKADTPEDARAILTDIAKALSATGVLRLNNPTGDAKQTKSTGRLNEA